MDVATTHEHKTQAYVESEQSARSRRVAYIATGLIVVAGGLALAFFMQGESSDDPNVDKLQAIGNQPKPQANRDDSAPKVEKKQLDIKKADSLQEKPKLPKENETKKPAKEPPRIAKKPIVKIDFPKKRPPKKNSAPSVKIDSVFPKDPKEGDTLLIAVAGKDPDGDKLRFEFRTPGDEKWTAAPDGLIKKGPLKSGKIELQIRAVDSRGLASNIVAKSWTASIVNRPPTITAIESVPATDPKKGVMIVRLKGADPDSDAIAFRYRTDVMKKWIPAKDNVVYLHDLSEKNPALFFQVVDKKGATSKMVKLQWGQLLRRQWQKLKKGDKLFQHLVVKQTPKYQFNGLNFAAGFQYTVLSQFIVKQRNADNSLVLHQTILAAKLNDADALSRPLLTGPVAAMPGTKFTISLSPERRVTKFDGFEDQPVVAAQKFLFGEGFQMVSLLDKDGWTELIEASFFLPDRPLVPGAKWARKMSHSWGALGSWHGNSIFLWSKRKANLHEIKYTYQMAHRGPGKQQGNILPAKIADAKFKQQQALGVIVFDQTNGRVLQVQEQFAVQGTLTMQILGKNAPMLVQETQRFQIRMLDRNPLKR